MDAFFAVIGIGMLIGGVFTKHERVAGLGAALILFFMLVCMYGPPFIDKTKEEATAKTIESTETEVKELEGLKSNALRMEGT